jgi:ABC-type multidrug transport system ATPase subunit
MFQSLICLDEPTSGLDSTSALTVVQSLKELAVTGATVVAVLHQPKYEVFQLFDQVLLLGKGGMTVYMGSTSQMSAYFEKLGFPCPPNANPADFYMDVVSGIVPHISNPNFGIDDLFEAWMCAEENPDSISPEAAKSCMESINAQKASEDSEKKSHSAVYRFFTGALSHIRGLCNHLSRDLKVGRAKRPTPMLFQ